MSIWGRRDSEPPAEEAHEGQAEARKGQAEARESQAAAQATQEPTAEHADGEPAPAFWRAQGETPAPIERDPADAPPPAYVHVPADATPAGGLAPTHGQQAPGEAAAPAVSESPAPAVSESPAGTDAPVPVPGAETAVKDPALTGTAGDQTGMHHADAAGAAATEAREPAVTDAGELVMAEAQEPDGEAAQGPAATEAQEPAAIRTGQPTAAAITPQRWSEILVTFVDDPRGSVKMAAGAVDEAIDEFVNSVRARQRALASSWQGTETGTEQLRTALRDYRKLWHQVQQLDLGKKTSA